ncbi:MAG: GTP cyclohydrolase I FolE2 [Fibrobacteria bacterium]|nr:GTP cyclohydrolase I FolE2 [Fibrobacteria bacterium]
MPDGRGDYFSNSAMIDANTTDCPTCPLPDVQSETVRVPRAPVVAGIDRVRFRLALPDGRVVLASVRIVAHVPNGHRGVHMSRMARVFAPQGNPVPLDDTLPERIHQVAATQESDRVTVRISWEDTIAREAPVTGTVGLQPYKIELSALWSTDSLDWTTRLETVTMLACPCSKALSGDLGFHNQRGILQAEVAGFFPLELEALLALVDRAGSNRTHPILRREDEKEVIDSLTRDGAFRFVEDAASRLLDLLEEAGHKDPSIHVRSLESIHAHDAIAWAGPRGEGLSEGIQP